MSELKEKLARSLTGKTALDGAIELLRMIERGRCTKEQAQAIMDDYYRPVCGHNPANKCHICEPNE